MVRRSLFLSKHHFMNGKSIIAQILTHSNIYPLINQSMCSTLMYSMRHLFVCVTKERVKIYHWHTQISTKVKSIVHHIHQHQLNKNLESWRGKHGPDERILCRLNNFNYRFFFSSLIPVNRQFLLAKDTIWATIYPGQKNGRHRRTDIKVCLQ